MVGTISDAAIPVVLVPSLEFVAVVSAVFCAVCAFVSILLLESSPPFWEAVSFPHFAQTAGAVFPIYSAPHLLQALKPEVASLSRSINEDFFDELAPSVWAELSSVFFDWVGRAISVESPEVLVVFVVFVAYGVE